MKNFIFLTFPCWLMVSGGDSFASADLASMIQVVSCCAAVKGFVASGLNHFAAPNFFAGWR